MINKNKLVILLVIKYIINFKKIIIINISII